MMKHKKLWLYAAGILCILIVLFFSFSKQIQYHLINRTSYPVSFARIGTMLGGDGPTIRLVEACREGDYYTAECLLKAGADPNFTYDGYFTAIEAAYSSPVKRNRLELAKLLVEYGADVTKHSSGSEAVFLEADFLAFNDPDKEDAIVENIAFLLSNGASFVDDRSGITLLHIAAATNNLKLAKLLIEDHGCPCDMKYRGETALDIAQRSNAMEVCGYLRDRGAVLSSPSEMRGESDFLLVKLAIVLKCLAFS